MKIKSSRLVLINQMAGILFKTLAKNLAPNYEKGVLLLTGHPKTIAELTKEYTYKCRVVPLANYNRRSNFYRLSSWFLFATQVVLQFPKLDNKDTIIVSSNPPFLPVLTGFLSKFFSIKYFVALYDIYPDVLETAGHIKKNGRCSIIWRYLNTKAYKSANGIITLDQRMANKLFLDYKINLKNILVVPPFVDTEFIKPIKRNKNPLISDLGIINKFCILYSGNMGKSHDIDSIIKASKKLENYNDIRFIFIGEGEYYNIVLEEIKLNNSKNVKLFPLQQESKLPYTLASANISLVSLDIGYEEIMIPSKSISYLAAGSPIVAICKTPSTLSDIIIDSRAGVVVEPKRPDLIVKAILNYYNNKSVLRKASLNARNAALSKYSLNANLKSLISFLGNTSPNTNKIL